jgi:methionyl-tRNA synthetase
MPCRISQSFYANLKRNGHLEKQDKEQTYCEDCARSILTSALVARLILNDT